MDFLKGLNFLHKFGLRVQMCITSNTRLACHFGILRDGGGGCVCELWYAGL
jgi:hypothetical protein